MRTRGIAPYVLLAGTGVGGALEGHRLPPARLADLADLDALAAPGLGLVLHGRLRHEGREILHDACAPSTGLDALCGGGATDTGHAQPAAKAIGTNLFMLTSSVLAVNPISDARSRRTERRDPSRRGAGTGPLSEDQSTVARRCHQPLRVGFSGSLCSGPA